MSRPATTPSVDVSTAARFVDQKAPAPGVLLDVRERDEHEEMRVPGAVLMPLSGFAETFGSLPRDRPILVMCASGQRSLAAADHLLGQGFTDVTNVTGGIIAWHKAGLPVKTGPVEEGEGDVPADR